MRFGAGSMFCFTLPSVLHLNLTPPWTDFSRYSTAWTRNAQPYDGYGNGNVPINACLPR